MYQDFPFSIVDVVYLLNLHIRHKNAASLDVGCPFCGEKKGKLNLNTKKNVFKCNRCGESGEMLSLYGKIYGLDNQTACKEIKDALGGNEQAPAYQVRKREIIPKEPEIENAPPAPDAVRHKTYSMFFSMLVLADTHRHALSGRTFGCVPGANQYANLPPFLQAMKLTGTETVYEAYDMDKLLKTVCRGDYCERK